MMNRQGYIKTLEAVIAIVMILAFTFAVTPKPEPSYKLPSSVENAQAYMLEELAMDDAVRSAVMSGDLENPEPMYAAIDTKVSENMPTGFEYTIGVCEESACASNSTPIAEDRSVYTAEAMFGSDIGAAGTPRIVRVWMWRK